MRGHITISRWNSSSGKEGISITITDDASNTQFLKAEIGLENFARAVTGLGAQHCDFDLIEGYVGKKHEHKTELVPVAGRSSVIRESPKWKAAMIAQMEVFEVDGWKGEESDLWNHHRTVRKKDGEFQSVAFHRYVRAAP